MPFDEMHERDDGNEDSPHENALGIAKGLVAGVSNSIKSIEKAENLPDVCKDCLYMHLAALILYLVIEEVGEDRLYPVIDLFIEDV